VLTRWSAITQYSTVVPWKDTQPTHSTKDTHNKVWQKLIISPLHQWIRAVFELGHKVLKHFIFHCGSMVVTCHSIPIEQQTLLQLLLYLVYISGTHTCTNVPKFKPKIDISKYLPIKESTARACSTLLDICPLLDDLHHPYFVTHRNETSSVKKQLFPRKFVDNAHRWPLLNQVEPLGSIELGTGPIGCT